MSSLLCYPPCATLGLLVQGDEDLLKVFLQYIHRCCSSSHPQTAVYLLGPELADLLDGAKVVRPEVRHGALSAVYAAMTAAMQGDEVRHAACTYREDPESVVDIMKQSGIEFLRCVDIQDIAAGTKVLVNGE